MRTYKMPIDDAVLGWELQQELKETHGEKGTFSFNDAVTTLVRMYGCTRIAATIRFRNIYLFSVGCYRVKRDVYKFY